MRVILIIFVVPIFVFAKGQLLKFPQVRPNQAGPGPGPTIDFGSITFQTARPIVVQGSVSAPEPAPTPGLALVWGVLETKSNTSTTATKDAKGGDGNPCPERHELRCVPRKECFGRPGVADWAVPDPRNPTGDAAVPAILKGDMSTPRIVNDPPEGVVCKQDELWCCAPAWLPPPPPPPTPGPPKFTCGWSNSIPVKDYKLKYAQAEFGEYPWMAVIFNEGGDVAAGALISERHVLTAAHKVYGRKPYKIRFGEWDMDMEFPEPWNTVEVPVAGYETHSHFNPVSLQHDIAILTLTRPLELHKYQHIRPVCLPNPKKDYVGQRCWASGFGKEAFKSDHGSQVLREVDLPIMANGECEKRLRTTALGPFYEFNKGHGSFLCAGGAENGKDTCKGDGGAPLVCKMPETGRFEAVGLVAWGFDCGKPGIPGVYVNLANYVDWIQERCKCK